MGLRRFLFGDPEEQTETVGYEVDLGDCGDAPFEGVPDANDVRNGAPSLFGDYSTYPGGYPQAVKDWRNGEYEVPEQDDSDDDDDDSDEEPEEQPKGFWGRLFG